MFKPNGGKWVPLRIIKWHAYGCVEGTSVKKSGQGAGAATWTDEHPVWTHYLPLQGSGDRYVDGACPNNAGCTNWDPQPCIGP